jgi:hypothetical protein
MARLRDLRFDLPPRFEDLTEYFFTSKPGPIRKLALSAVELQPKDVDAWLLEARRKLEVFPKAKRGPLQTYENPKYLVRGFETDFGSSLVVIALLLLERGALLLQAKCNPGFDLGVAFVFRTLDRDGDVEQLIPPATFRYHALGFRFHSLQSFEWPPYLTLEGPDQMLISGTASARPMKSERPDWFPSFALSVDSVVTETLQGREVLKARPTLGQAETPEFRNRYWLSSAVTEGVERRLLYGDATCHIDRTYYRFELRGQGPVMEQLDSWRAFLTSARRS